MEKQIEMITKNEYVLTNLHPDDMCYYIRLTDNIEYKVYIRKPKKGEKTYYFIKKDDREIKLDDEVRKWFKSEVRVYERDGI